MVVTMVVTEVKLDFRQCLVFMPNVLKNVQKNVQILALVGYNSMQLPTYCHR